MTAAPSKATTPTTRRLPDWLQRRMDRWPLLARLVKFGSVGFVAYTVDVTVFNLLLYVGAPPLLEGKPLVAKIVSTFLATVVAWLGNRYWTFSTRRSDHPVREFLLFAATCTIGLGVALIPLWVSHYVLGYTSPLADNIAANIVGLAMGTTFRFIAYSLVVFPSRRAAGPGSNGLESPDGTDSTGTPDNTDSPATLPRAASPS